MNSEKLTLRGIMRIIQIVRSKNRTDLQAAQDLVLALIVCFYHKGHSKIVLSKLDHVLGHFITEMELRGWKNPGFYPDQTSGVYVEIWKVFEDLMYAGFVRPEGSGDEVSFILPITERIAHGIEDDIPEYATVKALSDDLIAAYVRGSWSETQKEE